ncbi:hypothetical protein [Streptomyces canus]|uniref:hypothetical protein n=1 Tax=Streptomyces canus TaxID=58343 RepID=UPI0037125359
MMRRIVTGLADALRRGDIAAAMDLCSSDAVFEDVPAHIQITSQGEHPRVPDEGRLGTAVRRRGDAPAGRADPMPLAGPESRRRPATDRQGQGFGMSPV